MPSAHNQLVNFHLLRLLKLRVAGQKEAFTVALGKVKGTLGEEVRRRLENIAYVSQQKAAQTNGVPKT